MNKILTTPKLIEENTRVLYTGNHYIALPEIDMTWASIKNLNLISLSNKGLVELSGKGSLFKPRFFKDNKELTLKRVIVKSEGYYLPFYQLFFEDNFWIKVKIYPDLKEKGFVYYFESFDEVNIHLECNIDYLSFLRFNSHSIPFQKEVKVDKWLNNPLISLLANNTALALAFGGDKDFTWEKSESDNLLLKIKCNKINCFYITINSDPDGASTTLIHFKRKGYKDIYEEFRGWLEKKSIKYPDNLRLEKRMNQNLFFNYFFALGKDMESDQYLALTSRSPRYYVSGAFWERDSFLWSFPAIKLVDEELYLYLCREMIIRHSKNAGDHAHYLDGTILYPGFELDEAASYFILLKDLVEFDTELLRAIDKVLQRIEAEYDEATGLYKTFLMPSDDPSEHPFLTIDNVILWQGFKVLKEVYEDLGEPGKPQFLEKRIKGIEEGIYKYLVGEIEGQRIFFWSADGKGNYRLYNDPPGNLGLLPFYGFVKAEDETFKNTISYYYSPKYKYYFEDAKIKELACDHHPTTPSGLGLCGSILNPLMEKEALEWLKAAKMDYGLLAESFDNDTGHAKTGVGFATGSGYLAYALYHVLVEKNKK